MSRSTNRLSIVPPAPVIPADPYPAVSNDARLRIDTLAGKTRRVQAALSGAFTTHAALTEARRLAAEIERDWTAFRKALEC